MKEFFEKPNLLIFEINAEDILTTSIEIDNPDAGDGTVNNSPGTSAGDGLFDEEITTPWLPTP